MDIIHYGFYWIKGRGPVDIDSEESDRRGYTPAVTAALAGKVGTLRLLQSLGMDINRNRDNRSPLLFVMEKSSLCAIRILLQCKADPHKFYRERKNFIEVVIEQKRIDIIEILNKFEIDYEEGYISNKQSYLTYATSINKLEVVQSLLSGKAHINRTSRAGYSPLQVSVQKGHDEITKFLLSQRANPNVRKTNFNYKTCATPLMSAASRGNRKAVDLLLATGADINATDDFRRGALYFATTNQHTSLAWNLLDRGTSLARPKKEMETAMVEKEFAENRLFEIWGISDAWGASGSDINYTSETFTKYSLQFLRNHHHRFPISKTQKEVMCEALRHIKPYAEISTIEILERIHQRVKPTIILSGWSRHLVSLLFFDSLLFVCNRGEGSRKSFGGIRTFKIDPTDFNLTDLRMLFLGSSPAFPNSDFFEKFLLEKTIERIGGKAFSSQSSPNCCWSGAKLAFASLFFATFHGSRKILENCSLMLSWKRLWWNIKPLYKEFTLFARMKAFHDYINNPNYREELDHDLLEAILYKWQKKIRNRKERFCEEKVLYKQLERAIEVEREKKEKEGMEKSQTPSDEL